MKTLKINAFIILLLSALFITSCRTEEEELITPDTDQNLVANSVLANLLSRTSQNDGSIDNILDNANCFTVQLPATVFVNGLEILVDSEDDFETIEEIFDDFDGDISTLEFQYPITIILADFTEIVINNEEELIAQAANCNGDNEEDDDIECIDFQYPLSYSVFNTNNELIETVTVNNDEEHYTFLNGIDENDIISINFPFTLILADGNTIVVNSALDLADAIEAAIDACDEDDDNDYEDDDCENCTTDDLLDAFAGCDAFEVNKIKRNGDNFDDDYEDFTFQFFSDGTIAINDGSVDYSGSWTAEGAGQNITVTVNVPDFPIFNDEWDLHEISAYDGEVKVDLRKGNDRLRFKCDDDDDDNEISEFLEDCQFLDIIINEANNDTNDLNLEFQSDGTLILFGGNISQQGTWELTQLDGEDAIIFDIPNYPSMSITWVLVNSDDDSLELLGVEAGNSVLLLECIDEDERFDNITDSEWEASYYFSSNSDMTAVVQPYSFIFATNFTLSADSGIEPNQSGSWANSDLITTISISFPDAPLDALSSEWFILSYEEDEIRLVREVNSQSEFLTFTR